MLGIKTDKKQKIRRNRLFWEKNIKTTIMYILKGKRKKDTKLETRIYYMK